LQHVLDERRVCFRVLRQVSKHFSLALSGFQRSIIFDKTSSVDASADTLVYQCARAVNLKRVSRF
jgi:hypothetical protein